MFKRINNMIALVAAFMVAIVPVTQAMAQDAPRAYAAETVSLSEDMRVTMVEPAMGLMMKPEEARMLARDDCFVGPLNTSRELYDWADRKGIIPCSEDFYDKVDKYVGQESMVSFRVTRVADGYLHCPLAKAVNLGNNRQSCVTYPFNPSYNTRDHTGGYNVGKYADVNWAEGGQTVGARALTTLGGALIAGPMTAATASVLAPKCRGSNCGGGAQIYNLNQALADADSVSGAAATVDAVLGGCATGDCLPATHSVNPSTEAIE